MGRERSWVSGRSMAEAGGEATDGVQLRLPSLTSQAYLKTALQFPRRLQLLQPLLKRLILLPQSLDFLQQRIRSLLLVADLGHGFVQVADHARHDFVAAAGFEHGNRDRIGNLHEGIDGRAANVHPLVAQLIVQSLERCLHRRA